MAPNGYDIFVSYAHVDDRKYPGTDKGWVSAFVETLRIDLARELGRQDAYSLWMDYELRGHEPLTRKIHELLSEAKTLVLFLSRGYIASTWCLEELEAFAKRMGAGTDRIFPVYVSPVEQGEIPQPLADLPTYSFWVNEPNGPRTLADPQPIGTEREYYQGIRRLARELAAKLKGIAQPLIPPRGPMVFVNGGEQDLDLIRATAALLAQRGCGYLLPASIAGGGPGSTEAIARDLRENMEGCDQVLLVYRDGPRDQVRQYIKEYRKHRARSDEVPDCLHLCQAQPMPGDLGISIPELHLVCAGDTCLDECVDRFLEGHSP